MDEPLSSLDLAVRRELQGEVHRVWQRGLTCVLVTHELEEALVMATRVIVLSPRPAKVLYDGRVPLDFPRNRRSEAYQAVKADVNKVLEGLHG